MNFFDKIYPTVERYYRLFFSHRNKKPAWAAIGVGIILVSQPIWLGLIYRLINEIYDIGEPPQPAYMIGTFLILLGLLYHIIIFLVENSNTISNNNEKKKHDAHIFNSLNEIYGRNDLISIADNLMTNDAYRRNQRVKLDDFFLALENPENAFLIRDIEIQKNSLYECINTLLHFFADHFDKYPYDQIEENYQCCLEPRRNCDRAGGGSEEDDRIYMKLQRKLDEIVNELKNSHAAFIRISHEKIGSFLH